MTLAAGTQLGPYEILAPLGAGGMGEVFRARDTRLNRSVAIKTLAADLAADSELRQRFEVEARAVAALSHPNICALYDVGRERPWRKGTGDREAAAAVSPEVEFLVLELLTGESLADRLLRGPLPFDQLCQTASEIASALDEAHAHGITHRDLKPSNVMLTRSGAKLLDFGLAKLLEPPPAGTDMATRSFQAVLTSKGTVLGTFQYMAPEQVEGKDVDARADIFAFGALLHEMATGRRAFEGESQAGLTASILARDPPPVSSLQPALPQAFDHLVRRCLAKDPDERWQSVRDVLFELKWIREHGQSTAAAPSRPAIAWGVAGIAVLIAVAAVWLPREGPSDVAGLKRVELGLPPGTRLPPREIWTSLSVSPDGRHVAMAARSQGVTQLWVRSFDASAARALPGTEDARSPFWSPDSQYIGFFSSGKGTLQRVAVAGGPPQVICEAISETLPSWGPDGTILFANWSQRGREGIYRVSAAGGSPSQVTKLDPTRSEREHRWPSFLPDGEHFFYVAASEQSQRTGLDNTVFIGSLTGGDRKFVIEVDSRMTYVRPGYVLYAQDGALLARQFNLNRLELVGDPISVVDGVRHARPAGLVEMSASANGVLAFQESRRRSELVWLDRSGKELGTLGAPDAFESLRLSPDARRIVAVIEDLRTGFSDLWVFDVQSGIPTRFTTNGLSWEPVWSPDGETLFFRSGSPPDLFFKRADGRGGDRVLKALNGVQNPQDVSSDSTHLVYSEGSRVTGSDLWLLPLAGDSAPRPLLVTPADEMAARFSPDGRWLAFVSTESGSSEVY
ncbi:MAG: protein kinase domain-containing protein, partial [Vicinamibacterales bacterium]